MKSKPVIIGLAIAIAFAATQANAKPAKRLRPVCSDPYSEFSLSRALFGPQAAPQANGCAPAVYLGNRYVGQDPDVRIRYQLNRDAPYEGFNIR